MRLVEARRTPSPPPPLRAIAGRRSPPGHAPWVFSARREVASTSRWGLPAGGVLPRVAATHGPPLNLGPNLPSRYLPPPPSAPSLRPRRSMKECHPDLSGDGDLSTEFCKLLNEIYEVCGLPTPAARERELCPTGGDSLLRGPLRGFPSFLHTSSLL